MSMVVADKNGKNVKLIFRKAGRCFTSHISSTEGPNKELAMAGALHAGGWVEYRIAQICRIHQNNSFSNSLSGPAGLMQTQVISVHVISENGVESAGE